MKKAIFLIFSLVALVQASFAQDKEYYDNTLYDCSPSSRMLTWKVTEFKNGMAFNLPFIKQNECRITFSDECVEIRNLVFFDDDEISQNVTFHFPVKEYHRLSDESFEIFRSGDDAYFNYIQVIQIPNIKNKYRLLLSYLENGDMINTKIFNCTPIMIGTGSTAAEARGARGKSVGMPYQVRPKK